LWIFGNCDEQEVLACRFENPFVRRQLLFPCSETTSPRRDLTSEGVARHVRSPTTLANRGANDGYSPDDTRRRNRGSGTLIPPIDGPSVNAGKGSVVKTVTMEASRRQRFGYPVLCKLLNLQLIRGRVLTGDPLRPRRMEISCKSSLF
jgi:hypothetical protein